LLGLYGSGALGLRQLVGCGLNEASYPPADGQKRRSVSIQMPGKHLIEAFKHCNEAIAQGRLLTEHKVVVKHPFDTGEKPMDGGATGALLYGMNVKPMIGAKLMDESEPRHQPGKGFALVKRPCQPRTDAQILGLGGEEYFALLTDLHPVDLSAVMHGLRFTQLTFQRLIFA
jgi:hypothetical protein